MAAAGAAVISAAKPTHDLILAYETSQARHGAPGHEAADWAEAEKELKAKPDGPR